MSADALRVVVIGARGRLGAYACQLLRATAGFELVAELGREHELSSVLPECSAEVGLDVTEAGLGFEHGRHLLNAAIRPVIGTSGVSHEEALQLDGLARARRLGGLVVPNFSLGMVCLQRAAEDFARCFPDVEIVELHRAGKKDAPSGTARHTAERLQAMRGANRGAVPIHSVRLPGLHSHQEVLFGGQGETLSLRHDQWGPQAFGPGILAALRYVAEAIGVAYGLEAALD